MNTTVIHNTDYPDSLRRFIQGQAQACVYHTQEWRDILHETYGYSPHYILCLDANGEIAGFLPMFFKNTLIGTRKLSSLPFSHKVPILYRDLETLDALLIAAKEQATQLGDASLELKHGEVLDHPQVTSVARFYNSELNISRSEEELWRTFDVKKVRWGINRADRSELELDEGAELEHFKIFYELELITRKRQGAPPYAWKFFKLMHKKLGQSGVARVYLARFHGRPIAGIIALSWGHTCIFGYGASVSDSELLKNQPNHFAIWHAIKHARQHGSKVFDFGTTEKGNTGLLRFKNGWGTDTREIPYYYLAGGTLSSIDRQGGVVRFASCMIKKMPLCVLKRVGPVLLRQVG